MKDTAITVAGKCVGEYDMCPDDNRPDWEQNDPTKANYVHNRPGYRERVQDLCSAQEVDVISKTSGFTFKADNGTTIGRIASVVDSLKKRNHIYRVTIRQEYVDTAKGEYTYNWEMSNVSTNIIEDIGTPHTTWPMLYPNKVCNITSGNEVIYRVYFITDPTLLFDEYKNRFTEIGIYIEFVKLFARASKYCRISLETWKYNQLDAHYIFAPPIIFDIPSTVTAADAGKVLMIGSDGKPAWTTLPTSTDTSETT